METVETETGMVTISIDSFLSQPKFNFNLSIDGNLEKNGRLGPAGLYRLANPLRRLT